MVGKVIVAKAIGILSLYIGKTYWVINRLGRGKKNNCKNGNQLVIRQSLIYAYSMTRTRRGYIARRRRRKASSFIASFRGGPLKTQQDIRALASSHRDRNEKKRNCRRLWITRINSVIREGWVYYNYSKLIHDLYKRQLLLNRKILAQIVIANKNCLYLLSNEIIKKVNWKESAGVI